MLSINHRQQLNSRLIATSLFISGFVWLISVSVSVSVMLQSHREVSKKQNSRVSNCSNVTKTPTTFFFPVLKHRGINKNQACFASYKSLINSSPLFLSAVANSTLTKTEFPTPPPPFKTNLFSVRRHSDNCSKSLRTLRGQKRFQKFIARIRIRVFICPGHSGGLHVTPDGLHQRRHCMLETFSGSCWSTNPRRSLTDCSALSRSVSEVPGSCPGVWCNHPLRSRPRSPYSPYSIVSLHVSVVKDSVLTG
jgi:hypothetical protein